MFVFLKGAPEKVLKRVSNILIKNDDGALEEVPFQGRIKEDAGKANDAFGNDGERVLAFARAKLDPAVY